MLGWGGPLVRMIGVLMERGVMDAESGLGTRERCCHRLRCCRKPQGLELRPLCPAGAFRGGLGRRHLGPRLRVPSEPGQAGGLLGGPLRTCTRGFTNAALTQTKGRAGVLGDASTGGQSTSSEALVLLAAVSSVARARPPAAQAPEGSGAGVSEVGLCGYSLPRLVGVPRGREGTV